MNLGILEDLEIQGRILSLVTTASISDDLKIKEVLLGCTSPPLTIIDISGIQNASKDSLKFEDNLKPEISLAIPMFIFDVQSTGCLQITKK